MIGTESTAGFLDSLGVEARGAREVREVAL